MSQQGASGASTVEGEAVDDPYCTNKSFTFSARSAGLYTVYYIAHDHNGAYNTEKATVTVSEIVDIGARDASLLRDCIDPSKVEYLKAEFTAASAGRYPLTCMGIYV